jgi:hypothetical protein
MRWPSPLLLKRKMAISDTKTHAQLHVSAGTSKHFDQRFTREQIDLAAHEIGYARLRDAEELKAGAVAIRAVAKLFSLNSCRFNGSRPLLPLRSRKKRNCSGVFPTGSAPRVVRHLSFAAYSGPLRSAVDAGNEVGMRDGRREQTEPQRYCIVGQSRFGEHLPDPSTPQAACLLKCTLSFT